MSKGDDLLIGDIKKTLTIRKKLLNQTALKQKIVFIKRHCQGSENHVRDWY